jgi:hypothetical protein
MTGRHVLPRIPLVLVTAACAVLCMLALAASASAAWQRGANFNSYTPSGYGNADADASLERLAADGNDNVEIVVTWYQQTLLSNTIGVDPGKTPTDASVVHAMQKARSLGLRVTLKPHVNVIDGTWRGAIKPTDRTAWFASYQTMINHYANLARQNSASMFVVGTELKSLSGDTTRWNTVVKNARSRFAGKLTYAANYDEFEQVKFWGKLDYIGVDAYFALTSNVGDSIQTLASRWTSWGWKTKLVNVSFASGKPVIFTEIGYRSTPDTALHPGLFGWTGDIDLTAQQNAYEAFYQAFKDEGWFAGVYWWNWPAKIPASGGWDNDYPPINKPAEQTMKAWNAKL